MHSSLVRIQNVFGFFTTVAAVVATFVAISVVFSPQTPAADIKLRSVQVVKGRPNYYSTKVQEYAHIKFDLDADFTTLFNWNTKQLFVWVQATYPGRNPGSPPSQAVIWDSIVQSPAQADPPSLWALINRNAFDEPAPGSAAAKEKARREKKARSGKDGKGKDSKNSKSKSKDKKSKIVEESSEEEIPTGKIQLRNAKSKYQITDYSGKIGERGNVTLEVGWNVQPWVGALTWTQWRPFFNWQGLRDGRSEVFDFPALKGKKVETTGSAEVPPAGKAEPVVGR